MNEGHDIPADELNSINNKNEETDNNETNNIQVNDNVSNSDTSSEGGERSHSRECEASGKGEHIQVKQPAERLPSQAYASEQVKKTE